MMNTMTTRNIWLVVWVTGH